MTTTLRSDMVAGLYNLLVGFSAANSGQLNGVYKSRPASFGDRPLAFVGPRNESINHTGTTLYQRVPNPTIVFVWGPGNDGELADVRDDLIDSFIEYSMPRPHAISNQTTDSPIQVEDVELEIDGTYYPACVVTFQVNSLEGTP